jgi:hypothetical protein
MATETFNRYEKKYRLDNLTAAKIQSRLSGYMRPDKYNRGGETYKIVNLYYDTDDSSLIRNSLAKPAYKEKLRLRAYGTPDLDSMAYAEIQKKVGGVVNKRRSAMKLAEAYDFLASGTVPEYQPYMNRQVMAEIACFLRRNDVKPALCLAYERLAYFGDGERDLRVSFDTEIRARSGGSGSGCNCDCDCVCGDDLRLESDALGELLLGEGEWLMEIKTSRSIPVWLCRILSEYEIYPRAFSKYGRAYMRTLERKMPEQALERKLERRIAEPARAPAAEKNQRAASAAI